MTLRRDTIVPLTRDVQLRRGLVVRRGATGRVLSRVTFHHAYIVEFTIDRQTMVARAEDHDLVEASPNARM
jgi:hypothetical protein